MPTAYIMRGIPGSGKTRLADKIASELEGAAVLSADEIMFKSYEEFRPDKLTEVHSDCFSEFCACLSQRQDVVVDNTNISEWEWRKYVAAANLVGYEVEMRHIYVATLDDIRMCWRRQRWLDGKRMPAEVFDRMVLRYIREPRIVPDTFTCHSERVRG